MRGDFLALDATDGRVLAKRELGRPIAFSPVTDGDRVFVATESGLVACFGLSHDSID